MPGLGERAVIAKMSTRMISRSKRDKAITNKVKTELLTDVRDPGRWVKNKFSENVLSELQNIIERAEKVHFSMTSPFGDKGERLLPITFLFECKKKMGALEREFAATREKLKDRWESILQTEQERLGENFNIKDYPSKDRLDDKIQLNYRIEPVPDWVGSGSSHVIFNLEQDMAKEIIEEARQDERRRLMETLDHLFMRLLVAVEKMKEICLEDRRVHTSLLPNIETESRMIKELNFTGDPDVDAIADEIRDKLTGWPVRQIRKDKFLKRKLGLAAESIADKIKARLDLGIAVPVT